MRTLITAVLLVMTSQLIAQVQEIVSLLKEKPKTEETAVWLCDTAFTFYASDPFLSQKVATIGLKKGKEWDIPIAIAKANHVIGISYWARDLYDSALMHYIEALKHYDALGVVRGSALINMNIGTIYDDLGQSERGKKYLLNSLKVIRNLGDTTNLVKSLNNLAVLYANIGLRDSALIHLRESLDIRLVMGDSNGVARTHNNVADIYIEHTKNTDFHSDDIHEAHVHLKEGLLFLNDSTDKNLACTMYANMGKVLLEMNRYEEAKSYLDKALKVATSIDSKVRQELAHHYYTQLYEKQGDYQKALVHYKQHTELDKEQRNADITAQIDKLNIQYETEKKERLLAEAARKHAIERSNKNLILISSSALILIIGLLLFNVLQKRKKDKQIATLKLQKLNEEIDKKNKEISSYTLSFIQKNQIMDELKEQINELKKQSDATTNKQLNRINRIVDETFKSDEEWKTFQITFDQMHDGFFALLKNEYPDLGNAELKLCALLRLNMNLKESAKILGISPDSVKTARYRLRKKLGLKTEENLIDFLIRFEHEHLVTA